MSYPPPAIHQGEPPTPGGPPVKVECSRWVEDPALVVQDLNEVPRELQCTACRTTLNRPGLKGKINRIERLAQAHQDDPLMQRVLAIINPPKEETPNGI